MSDIAMALARLVARSFTEFLEHAIKDPHFRSGGGGGKLFWSDDGPTYGEPKV